jgi:hypothetical protein
MKLRGSLKENHFPWRLNPAIASCLEVLKREDGSRQRVTSRTAQAWPFEASAPVNGGTGGYRRLNRPQKNDGLSHRE